MIELVIEEPRRSIGPFEVGRVPAPFAKRRMRKGWPLRALHIVIDFVQDQRETAMTRLVTVEGGRDRSSVPGSPTSPSARR